jgi:hypothetical protein
MYERPRRRPLGLLAGLALAAGCGDGSTEPAPTTGSIEIAVTTTGESLDPDGYTIALDGGAAVAIGVNETRTLPQVSPGDHSVQLEAVASNCALAVNNPQTAAGMTVP